MKCDNCNIDMDYDGVLDMGCGCCGTKYYKCPQCGATKTKEY